MKFCHSGAAQCSIALMLEHRLKAHEYIRFVFEHNSFRVFYIVSFDVGQERCTLSIRRNSGINLRLVAARCGRTPDGANNRPTRVPCRKKYICAAQSI
eukprot:5227340-Pleurochrysis_carterae.AAC.5